MSVLLGHWEYDGTPLPENVLSARTQRAMRYADNRGRTILHRDIAMAVLPYASHARDGLRMGLLRNSHGDLLSFDGRLDNCEELAGTLELRASEVSDAEIVLAAFSQWGEDSFTRLIGDWALCLWSQRVRRLYLARDHAGARTLYYVRRSGSIAWSTLLDDLVEPSCELSEEYATRYLSCRRTEQFTPYKNIYSVRPGHAVVVEEGRLDELRHWNALVAGSVTYTRDWEYEDHFRWLFERAVTRRTGDGAPILAQLSGGMDSSSIVCMSDAVRRRRAPDAELLDTISFYDDSERTLDDKRYFMAVEAQRGKVGIHLDTAFSHRTFDPVPIEAGRYLLPGTDSCSYEREVAIQTLTAGRGYRSILSGIGGDEVLGGVPTPFPELGDLLTPGSFMRFLRHAFAWSMPSRTPLIRTIADTVRFQRDVRRSDRTSTTPAPEWLTRRMREAYVATPLPFELDQHAPPGRLSNAWAWGAVLETLPHVFPNILSRLEYRYPFLDRDLVEFLFRIPLTQILRPGRNRDLMRRALGPLLPVEVANRKMKGFQQQAPMLVLERSSLKLKNLLANGCLVSSGFVDEGILLQGLERLSRGLQPELMQPLFRAIGLELWMRSLPASTVPAPNDKEARAFARSTSSGGSRSTNSQETTGKPVVV